MMNHDSNSVSTSINNNLICSPVLARLSKQLDVTNKLLSKTLLENYKKLYEFSFKYRMEDSITVFPNMEDFTQLATNVQERLYNSLKDYYFSSATIEYYENERDLNESKKMLLQIETAEFDSSDSLANELKSHCKDSIVLCEKIRTLFRKKLIEEGFIELVNELNS